jgi:endonuclease G
LHFDISGQIEDAMSGQKDFTLGRRDLLTTTDQNLSKAMAEANASSRALAVTANTAPAVEPAERLAIRRDLLEPPQADPTGFERIIGKSDLTSINYLERGKRASMAVCRIRVPSPGGEWYGTGFLVGPRKGC